MAEKKSSRKPLSLNDSHYRFLQDLASPSKPTANISFPEYEEKPSFAKLTASSKKSDDVWGNRPQFSRITRLDSALEDSKPTKIIPAGRLDVCSVLSRDSDRVENRSVNDEQKPTKVKIEGRRRLCKVSSREVENTENKAVVDDEPKFSDITDFDSPPQPNNVSGRDNYKGGNEIRDILNDLTSRLEILSIEKKRPPKTINPVDGLSGLVKNGDIGQGSKVNLPEYASAESSFSCASDISDLSSGATKDRVGGVFESVVDDYEESRVDSVEDEGPETENVGIWLKKNEPRREDYNMASARESFESNLDEEDGDSWAEVGGDEHLSRVLETKNHSQRQKENESRRVHERLRSVGRSFVPNGREEDDDDDCVVVSGNEVVNKPERRGGKFKESAHSGVIDVLDDYTNDSVLDNEGSITLSGPRSAYMLPGKIGKMLFPHQREGLKWLWSLHCQGKGGILGDDMGLGKTMQICGFLAGLFHSRLIKRALVVAPKTLLSHWIKELCVVGLSSKTREYFGTCAKTRQYELQYVLQDKGVLLTTYDIVRNNSNSLRGNCYLSDSGDDDATWDYMILDEGHLIKNPSTQRAKSLLGIPSAHRIIISGTPIQNNLKELWALFNFCCPELLGDNKWFKEKYELPILRGNDKHATDREKRVGSAVAKELRERIQPYFLRRLKNEVFREDDETLSATLSKKNEIIVWLKLTSCQRQLYEAFLNSELVLSAFDGSPLAALTILKKICDHPLLLTKRAAEDVLDGMDSMLNPEDAGLAEKLAMYIVDVAEKDDFQEQHDNISCKLSFILSLLGKLITEGHHVLIFSQTRKMLNLIQESIASKYKFLRIDGTTKASDRVKIVNDFQEGELAPIFLLTSQVGGLGLTLTRADRVIVVDPAWNPSTDNQSVDRAYRIGQKKDVIVYRLMTCGTVEEKIYRKQIYKGGLFKTATEHKEQIRYFSQQDLQELFSLPKHGFDISLTQKQLHEEHDHEHNMEAPLEAHLKFLKTLGIAGVSHHSLLFSKTAPVQVVQEEEEEDMRRKTTTFVRNSSSNYSLEHNVDGAEYAFNPKDITLKQKSLSPKTEAELTESQIKERINRLSQIFANKGTVERLPDKGAKIQQQIAELTSELNRIGMEKRTKQEVVDLDDVSGKLERVLNV